MECRRVLFRSNLAASEEDQAERDPCAVTGCRACRRDLASLTNWRKLDERSAARPRRISRGDHRRRRAGGRDRPRPAQPDRRAQRGGEGADRSEEHTSELQSLMRISYAVFCWKKKKKKQNI